LRLRDFGCGKAIFFDDLFQSDRPQRDAAIPLKSSKKELSAKQREELLKALKARFEKNMNRHEDLEWAKVQAKLEAKNEKL
jgi:Protein of unknown function (DUF4256)